MEVGSLSSSNTSAYSVTARQPQDTAPAQNAAPRTETKPAEQAPPPRKEEAPRPVVNAQGQTTGTRINVTA